MESYIVQVYRRGPRGALRGLVECVGIEGRHSFGSMRELWELLAKLSAAPEKRAASRSASPQAKGGQR